MTATAKTRCYACERQAGRTAVVVQNLYDGERLVMHRHCMLQIIDKIAEVEGDELLAAQLHHHLSLQGIFNDGDAAVRERKAEAERHEAQRKLWFDPVLFPEQEPVVPQNPVGYRPDLDDDEENAS